MFISSSSMKDSPYSFVENSLTHSDEWPESTVGFNVAAYRYDAFTKNRTKVTFGVATFLFDADTFDLDPATASLTEILARVSADSSDFEEEVNFADLTDDEIDALDSANSEGSFNDWASMLILSNGVLSESDSEVTSSTRNRDGVLFSDLGGREVLDLMVSDKFPTITGCTSWLTLV